jgi:LPS export ABC transporter protein LptC
LVAAALGCGSPLEVLEANGHGPVQIPPIALKQIVFEGYHGDLRDLSVTAASAVVDTTTQIAHLSDVAIGFAGDESGRVEISAPVGDFHLDGDDFTLSGGVKGSTGEGEHFTTTSVRYVAKQRMLHSDDPVVIARSNVEITGKGMELELAHQKLRLLGSVRARVQPQ